MNETLSPAFLYRRKLCSCLSVPLRIAFSVRRGTVHGVRKDNICPFLLAHGKVLQTPIVLHSLHSQGRRNEFVITLGCKRAPLLRKLETIEFSPAPPSTDRSKFWPTGHWTRWSTVGRKGAERQLGTNTIFRHTYSISSACFPFSLFFLLEIYFLDKSLANSCSLWRSSGQLKGKKGQVSTFSGGTEKGRRGCDGVVY